MNSVPTPVYMHSLPASTILRDTGKLVWNNQAIHIDDSLPIEGVWDGPTIRSAKRRARAVLFATAETIGVDFEAIYSEEQIAEFNAKLKIVADAMEYVGRFVLSSGFRAGGVSYGISFTHLPAPPKRLDEIAA